MNIYLWLSLIVILIVILYILRKYLTSPKRKLNKAVHNGTFYFLDNDHNIRENFFITYKGHLFQGEKYTNNQSHSSDVHSIFISIEHSLSKQTISEDDRHFIEKAIHASYPKATIDWKNTNTD